MRIVRQAVVAVLVLVAFALPSDGCGPFFAEAVFVQRTRPDGEYATYAAGRIGVPQPGYRVRHLVIAYDWAMGHGLSAGEQAQAVALDKELYTTEPEGEGQGGGVAAWVAARQGSGVAGGPRDVPATPGQPGSGTPATASIVTDREVPGEPYQTFVNCLAGAFTTAAETLAERRAAHGGDPAFADWVRGEDAVFANCGGDEDRLPAAVGAGAPVWLQKDRAYQIAAAKFYAEDYDGAIAGLKAIAADAGSPWRETARLVMARAWIRRGTVGQITELPAELRVGRNAPYSEAREKAVTAYNDALAKRRPAELEAARVLLAGMVADPAMGRYRASASGLLDFVELRLHPGAQGAVLERRLTAADRPETPGQFRQGLIDLNYLTKNNDDAGGTGPRLKAAASETGLIGWLATMRMLERPGVSGATTVTKGDAASTAATVGEGRQRAMAGWRSARTAPWLLAAMTEAQPGGADAAELAGAAANVPASSAMGVAATFYRLRWSNNAASTRAEVERLLPRMEAGQSRSTVNLFVGLRQRTSPTLAAFLADAGTIPAGVNDGEEEDPEAPSTAANKDGLCHVTSPDSKTRLFDRQAATVLNARMPLTMMGDAAESSSLPANLRFQVAQAAWTRAVLLDRPEVAKRMSPVLEGCYPAWKPVLDKYDAAASAEDRRANGLLALMRFASTEPVARDGEQRPEGFATYSEYRDNWWGASQAAGPVKQYDGTLSTTSVYVPTLFGQVLTSRSELPDPPFVAVGDRSAAEREVAELAKVPCASDFFAEEALRWQKAHPTDPRTPDILGFAERVVRNGCRTDATGELNHQLFTVVQGTYPKSEWAKKYTSWE